MIKLFVVNAEIKTGRVRISFSSRERGKKTKMEGDDYKDQYKKFTPDVDVPISWSEATTLEEYVRALFEKGIVKDPLIDTLVVVYGREKMREFYKKWREGKK